MRVTRETRERTRQAILDAASSQFLEIGFEAAKTREIAAAAGIAAGTLFNYFPSKESLGLALVSEAVDTGEVEFDATRRAGESLEERLFAYVAIQLRHLAPTRAWVVEVLETALSPLRAESPEGLAGDLRCRHLERVSEWLRAEEGLHPGAAENAMDLHLYWTLYLGALGFWARDDSHNQEATLALLDRSIGLFCHALREE